MAVAPEPATTRTLTIGPISRTTARPAPAPERSTAPSSPSSWLSWKTMITQNGMATSRVGMNDTWAMNHDCSTNSRIWNGRLNIWTKVSRHMA